MAELEASRELSRDEVADYLHQFADQLEGGTGHRTVDSAVDDAHRTTGSTARGTDSGTSGASGTADTYDRPEGNRAATDAGSGAASTDTADTTNTTNTTNTTADTNDAADPRYDKMTFLVGNDSATINPPGTVKFDISVDSDSSLMESGRRETVDFHIEWDSEDVQGDDELSIE